MIEAKHLNDDALGRALVTLYKENWQPKVESIARGQVTREFFPGTDLDTLLAEETLVFDGRVIDADGHVGGGPPSLLLRLVGVQTPKGDGVFLTTLAPRIGPLQLAGPVPCSPGG